MGSGPGDSRKPSYDDLAALVVEQAQTIKRLEGEIVELRAEVVELKRQLAQSSRNSSRPPSSDGLAKPAPKSLRKSSGRKPGGQDGHKGGHLAQAKVPDEVIEHPVTVCAGCAGDLADSQLLEPQRRQVLDLPKVRLHVREHQAERRRCQCGHESTAAFPDNVSAPVQYGPGVRAAGIYLINYQHLPYARAAQLLEDCFGARVSVGTLAAIVAEGAEGLDGFIDQVRTQMADAGVCHFDETGGRIAGRLHWIHSASTSLLTLYLPHAKRGREGIDAAGVLTELTGVAMHDGWAPYRSYPLVLHALCNAHHLRELQGITDTHPGTQTWAQAMTGLLLEAKTTATQAARAGLTALAPATLTDIQDRYALIIAQGHQQNPPATKRTRARGPIARTPAANLLRRLDEHRHDTLRFATDLRVPFDNNQAERDIRMVKLQQKISGCWRTLHGAHSFLTVRSYISTARKHGHNPLHVLGLLTAGTPWIPTAAGP